MECEVEIVVMCKVGDYEALDDVIDELDEYSLHGKGYTNNLNQKLAYKVDGQTHADCHYITMSMERGKMGELEGRLEEVRKHNKNVLRYLIVSSDRRYL